MDFLFKLFYRFFPRSVDHVLAAFHQQVAHLETLALKHETEAEQHNETAQVFNDLAKAASEEGRRAVRVSEKLRDLLS